MLDGEPVECVGEVVRHVDSAQARTWGMPPGVGLQFINPSPELREYLRQLRPSRAVPATPAPVSLDCRPLVRPQHCRSCPPPLGKRPFVNWGIRLDSCSSRGED